MSILGRFEVAKRLPKAVRLFGNRNILTKFYLLLFLSIMTRRLSLIPAGASLASQHEDKISQWLSHYDYSRSTEDSYAITDPIIEEWKGRDDVGESLKEQLFVGKYADERAGLDYTYHKFYNTDRQILQDSMIDLFHDTVVHDTENNTTCEVPSENWMVFTAGCMGAGKGHTIHWLSSQGLFPLSAFVRVDPDDLRDLLPELPGYIKENPATAGYLTQKEAGYIAEVLTADALAKGKNVLVDGSLRDADWYKEYFLSLQSKYPKLRLAIIHVTASESTVFERVAKRSKETGRIVPRELLEETMRQIPISLRTLAPYVDLMATFSNDNDTEVPELLWSSRRPSPSTSDLSSLPAFGEDPDSAFSPFNMNSASQFLSSDGSSVKDGEKVEEDAEESLTDTPPSSPGSRGNRERSLSQHRVTYNIEGEGVVVSDDATTGMSEIEPSEEWKSSFRSIWKMHCPLPSSKGGR